VNPLRDAKHPLAVRGTPTAASASARTASTMTAVALAYTESDVAPRVVAKGKGVIAVEIIRRAREAGVFVHESAELVGLLAKLDLDAHIPPALYFAIAEILAWIYAVERNGGADGSPGKPHDGSGDPIAARQPNSKSQ
jgi:flagellar biosynthesis protein